MDTDEPEELMCPITRLMLRDPVVNLAGHTYERSALETYWTAQATSTRGLMDPNTNQPVRNRTLITNWDKRKDVAAWLERHPDITPEGWETREVPPPAEGTATSTPTPVSNRNGAVLEVSQARMVPVMTIVVVAWASGAYCGMITTEGTAAGGAGGIFLLLFAVVWNCFVAVWTFLATAADAPLPFILFSTPFWWIGGGLLRQALGALLGL